MVSSFNPFALLPTIRFKLPWLKDGEPFPQNLEHCRSRRPKWIRKRRCIPFFKHLPSSFCLYCFSMLLSVFVWRKLLQRTTRINSRLVLVPSAQSLPVASDPWSLNQKTGSSCDYHRWNWKSFSWSSSPVEICWVHEQAEIAQRSCCKVFYSSGIHRDH